MLFMLLFCFPFLFYTYFLLFFFFFFSSRRRHTRCLSDWSSDVCSSDLVQRPLAWSLDSRLTSLRPPTKLFTLNRTRRSSRPLLDFAERSGFSILEERSEERRVGKECRSRWAQYH